MPRRTSVGMAELETKPHILYRFYDRTNVLVYVGITVNLGERMKQHAADKDWWSQVDRSATRIEYFNSRRAALDAEREVIKAERPLHNDQHNEWVDADEDEPEDPLHNFAVNVLSWLSDEEREPLLKQAEFDHDGEPRSKRDQDIEAADDAVILLWRERRNLLDRISDMLDLLPDGLGDALRAEVEQAKKAESEDSGSFGFRDNRLSQPAFDRYVNLLATEALGRLPKAEADEWMESARTLQIDTADRRIIFAASYSELFRHRGGGFKTLCGGLGEHGARCPKKTAVRTFMELCLACSDGACQGHAIWCAEHAKAALAGDLHMLDTSRATLWPIARHEPIESADGSVPF